MYTPAKAIDTPNAKMTKKGYKEQKRDLEEKIPDYQIGEISCSFFIALFFVVSLRRSMYSNYLDYCRIVEYVQ